MIRFPLLTMTLALAATSFMPFTTPSAHAAETAAFTPAQKMELESLIKNYIMAHPETLIESVNKYQASQEEEANKDADAKAREFLASLKDQKDLALVGNPEGDITVVEFYDYNCGYCKKAYEEVIKLLNEDKGVKVVFIDMPILGPSSVEAAKWSLASKKQGKYFEFHKALMAATGERDDEHFRTAAKEAGLDVAKLEKDKADPAIDEEIKSHLSTAHALSIQGTPGFIINEKVFRGYIPYEAIQSTIKDLRAKK